MGFWRTSITILAVMSLRATLVSSFGLGTARSSSAFLTSAVCGDRVLGQHLPRQQQQQQQQQQLGALARSTRAGVSLAPGSGRGRIVVLEQARPLAFRAGMCMLAEGGGGGGGGRAAVDAGNEAGTAKVMGGGTRPGTAEGRRTNADIFKAFYNDVWHVDMPEGHRFPMHKYREVRETVQNDEAAEQGLINLTPSPLASAGDLRTTHCPEYINRYITGQLTPKENRNIGFPWSMQHVKRALSSVGGTLAATHAVCRWLTAQLPSGQDSPPKQSWITNK
jgi:hypothetical protein